MFVGDVFNGRSRSSRVNFATDHIADRQSQLQAAREAREERERQQKQRKAKMVLCRALLQYACVRRLQAACVARIESLDQSSSCDSDSESRVVEQLKAACVLRRNSVSGSMHHTRVATLLLNRLCHCVGQQRLASLFAHYENRSANLGLQRTLLHAVYIAGVDGVPLEDVEWLVDGRIVRFVEAVMQSLQTPHSNEEEEDKRSTTAVLESWIVFLLQVASTELLRTPLRSKDNTQKQHLGIPHQFYELAVRQLASVSAVPSLRALQALVRCEMVMSRGCTAWPSAAASQVRLQWSNAALEAFMSTSLSAASPSIEGDAEVSPVALCLIELTRSVALDEATAVRTGGSSLRLLCDAIRRIVSLAPLTSLLRRTAAAGGAEVLVDALMQLMDAASLQLADPECRGSLTVSQFLEMTQIDRLYDNRLGLWQAWQPASVAADAAGKSEAFSRLASLLSTPLTIAFMIGDDKDSFCTLPLVVSLVRDSNFFSLLQRVFVSGDVTQLFAAASSDGAAPLGTSSMMPWWVKGGEPKLSVTTSGVAMLFLHCYLYYVDSGAFFASLRARRNGNDEEVRARGLVRILRDVVVRAHLYGCDSLASEVIATKACILMGKLHVVDEIRGFCGTRDWMSGVSFNPSAISNDWQEALVDDEADAAESGLSDANQFLREASRRAQIKHQARRNFFVNGANWSQNKRLVSLLRNAPFTVAFDIRVQVFSCILSKGAVERDAMAFRSVASERFHVRRGQVFEDAFKHFRLSPLSRLRQRIFPSFVNDIGNEEAGVGEGVYRDFMFAICKEGFSPEYGLFCKTSDGLVYPNPLSKECTQDENHLKRLAFLGAIVGKALSDGILLDLPFAPHFRNALLGRHNSFDYLALFDPQLYDNLIKLRHMTAEEIDTMSLTFTATTDVLGAPREVELVPGGSTRLVSHGDVSQYVLRYADYRLNRENAAQTRAFQQGLHEVVESTALQIFGSNELDLLFQGLESETGLNVDDWEANTEVRPADMKSSDLIKNFWRYVRESTPEQQRQLLAFVTSTRRAPLLGFRHMVPRFSITVTDSSPDFLPSSATCFCLLKLPKYKTFDELKKKLSAAVDHGKTFELS